MNKLSNKPLSDSAEFNYLLNEVRDSIDIEIAKAVSVSNNAFDIINKYGNQRLEDVKFQIKNISDSIKYSEDPFSYLNNENDSFIEVDLSCVNLKNDTNYSFLDPKTNTYLSQSCVYKSKRLISKEYSYSVNLNSISVDVYNNINGVVINRNSGDIIDCYIFTKTPISPSITFSINYDEPEDLDLLYLPQGFSKYLKLKILSEFSQEIAVGTSSPSLFADEAILHIRDIENSNPITLISKSMQAKATNMIEDFESIVDDYQYMQIPDNNYQYNWYVYNIKLRIDEICYAQYKMPTVFISPTYRIEQFQSAKILFDYSIYPIFYPDVYLEIKDFDSSNNQLSSEILPLFLRNFEDRNKYREWIYFENNKAVLSFYCNGQINLLDNTKNTVRSLEILDDKITVSDNALSAWQLVEYYTTNDSNNWFPYGSSTNKILTESIFKYSVDDIIKFEDDIEYPPDSPNGSKYLKIKLDFNIEIESIERIFDDGTSMPEQEPIYYYDGAEQNVFLKGRVLYIPFDTDTYPYLYNCAYKIKYYMLSPLSSDKYKYFYNNTSQYWMCSNWEHVKNLKDYSYSTIRLCVVARDYRSGEYLVSEIPFALNSIRIGYSTYNDLQGLK